MVELLRSKLKCFLNQASHCISAKDRLSYYGIGEFCFEVFSLNDLNLFHFIVSYYYFSASTVVIRLRNSSRCSSADFLNFPTISSLISIVALQQRKYLLFSAQDAIGREARF